MFWEKYVNLCVEHHTSPNRVASILEISSGAVTKWKNGAIPSATTLAKIAKYFNVTNDQLIDKKEKPAAISDELMKKIEENPAAVKLLDMLLQMSPEQLNHMVEFIKGMK